MLISHEHLYDIVIEKGVLAKAGDWVKSLWQPQKNRPYYR